MITIYESREEEIEIVTESLEPAEKPIEPVVEPEKKTTKDPDGLSPNMVLFLEEHTQRMDSLGTKSGPTIKVSEVFGGLARLYERVRTTVEYKGEHVLRRNAIERILKRLVWEKESVRQNLDNKHVSESLIKELILARYLPNDFIPLKKSEEVEKTVDKYLYLLKNLDNIPKDITTSKVRAWIWGVASSEIEDTLDPSFREIYVNLMVDWFKDYFLWTDNIWDEHEKDIQVYLAVHRAFTKSDEAIMRYYLLLKELDNWKQADKEQIHKFIVNFPKIYSQIEKHLEFPGRFALYRKVQKHAAAFDVFREISHQERTNLKKLVLDKEKFEAKVRDVCDDKYRQIKQRVNTGIVRSIVYIFLTKVFIALGLEIPYEVFVYGDIKYIPISINVIVPPLMMWMIGLSIKVPGAKNTQAIIQRLKSVVYYEQSMDQTPFSLKKSGNTSSLAKFFGIIYAGIFVFVFGNITYLLTLLNFSIIGIFIFFIFLSLVMLFAFRVRFNANQFKVDSDEEGFLSHLSSYLTLPFLNFGFYLSRALSKINVLTIFLDFLIEIPLKNIIEIFEEWTSFLREKKEEVVEIPD